MILINSYEKDAIRERFPHVCIVRTMRQKSKRHKYYCEEDREAMRFLATLRRPQNDGDEVVTA